MSRHEMLLVRGASCSSFALHAIKFTVLVGGTLELSRSATVCHRLLTLQPFERFEFSIHIELHDVTNAHVALRMSCTDAKNSTRNEMLTLPHNLPLVDRLQPLMLNSIQWHRLWPLLASLSAKSYHTASDDVHSQLTKFFADARIQVVAASTVRPDAFELAYAIETVFGDMALVEVIGEVSSAGSLEPTSQVHVELRSLSKLDVLSAWLDDGLQHALGLTEPANQSSQSMLGEADIDLVAVPLGI